MADPRQTARWLSTSMAAHPCRRERIRRPSLENFIASASIVSASYKGHPVDALALEADEGRCRLR